jgi:sigma-E factor negative regulatory protein RseC
VIEARAEVVRRDAGSGRVWLRLREHPGGCGRCDQPGGCHATRITDIFKGAAREFVFEDALGLVAGERVKIVIDEAAPLRAALASYGLGTALLLLGAAAGKLLMSPAWSDPGAACGAALGGLLALALLRHRARRGLDGLHARLERDEDDGEGRCAHPHGMPE